jgi:Exo70 exocyst complex subunit
MSFITGLHAVAELTARLQHNAPKERFTRFYDLLQEVPNRHQMTRVLDTDELGEVGREALAEEVCMLVGPAFRRFVQRMKDREFSKSKHFNWGVRIMDANIQ